MCFFFSKTNSFYSSIFFFFFLVIRGNIIRPSVYRLPIFRRNRLSYHTRQESLVKNQRQQGTIMFFNSFFFFSFGDDLRFCAHFFVSIQRGHRSIILVAAVRERERERDRERRTHSHCCEGCYCVAAVKGIPSGPLRPRHSESLFFKSFLR